MALVPRAEGIWTIDHALTVGGMLPMGTRTTIVRLRDGSLLLHAPGSLSPEDIAAIRALGPVAAVVAPNLEHYLFYGAAREAFPDARGFAAPGLEKRLKAPIDAVFNGQNAGPWAGTLEQHFVGGLDKLQETVLFHPDSRTLIITDLCFNIRKVDSWFPRTMLSMLDAYGRFGPSFLFRNVFTSDKAALRRSIDHILSWDFDRVILTHGDVVESGGREGLREGFTWAQ